MITKDNLRDFLTCLGFQQSETIQDEMHLHFANINSTIAVDFTNELIKYPDGVEADRDTTKNFSKNENFVVLECVVGLFAQGYKPEHIVLEPETPGGRENGYYYGDILIRDNDKRPYLLIECKTEDGKEDDEFQKAWRKTLLDGDQLFNYYNTYRQAQYLALYASDFVDGEPRCDYRLITMTDNNDYLESNPHLVSYTKVSHDNGTRDDFFRVWCDTYGKDFSTNGAFEVEEVPAFGIKKKKLTFDALDDVEEDDIQKKYHQFAQILRQYNVASHENAFDKLVNLFLVKVVDESQNKNDLQFLWKGAAYDDYYSFQDRLQRMYHIGMRDYLGEQVTYVDNESIDNAFRLQRNDPDAIKKQIVEYFRELKFYSNSDFGFLDVHNKELFFQNAVILKAMVEMLQNIKLKTDVQNQFLGDLFENFLDQGVKQNEGQYFTPTPITRFMVSSLPLEELIKGNMEIPKAIDYACGAGHFLNEYASQIREFVIRYKGKEQLSDYYKNIYGIEKEYRLSKVSKVSSIMYGQDGIQIVYGDGLVHHDKIEEGGFKVLVANPPYSVTGFLKALSKEERNAYALGREIKDKAVESCNYIESFFIERAKQLLAPEGIAAIILPYTVLTGADSMYKKTREILLQSFDIISIAHFGDGTFGRTGTNTAVLFLRRKKNKPDFAEHCRVRINSWFKNDHSQDQRYQDLSIISEYVEHIGIEEATYMSLVHGELTEGLQDSDLYNRYYEVFSNDSTAKNIKDKKITAKYTEELKERDLERYIFDSIRTIESEKLLYFMICSQNPCNVVVVDSPISKNKKDKSEQEFLGYNWSTAKGREGIHCIIDDDSTETDSGNNRERIKRIKTPLFNPVDFSDITKVNTIIRNNYKGIESAIPEQIQKHVKFTPLIDMIDFNQTSFDEAINIVPQHQIEIDSTFDCPNLGSLIYLNELTQNPSKWDKEIIYVDISSVEKNTGIISYSDRIVGKKAPSRARRIVKDHSVLISTVRPNLKGFAYVEKEIKDAIYSTGFAVLRPQDENVLNSKYLYYMFMYLDVVMSQIKAMMPKGAYPSINADNIKKIRIPLPNPDIQTSVIRSIEAIEKKFHSSRMKVEDLQKEVMKVFVKNKIVNSEVGDE